MERKMAGIKISVIRPTFSVLCKSTHFPTFVFLSSFRIFAKHNQMPNFLPAYLKTSTPQPAMAVKILGPMSLVGLMA